MRVTKLSIVLFITFKSLFFYATVLDESKIDVKDIKRFIQLEENLHDVKNSLDKLEAQYYETRIKFYKNVKLVRDILNFYIVVEQEDDFENKVVGKILLDFCRFFYQKDYQKLKMELFALLEQIKNSKTGRDKILQGRNNLLNSIENNQENLSKNTIYINKEILFLSNLSRTLDELIINLEAELSIGMLSDVNVEEFDKKFDIDHILKFTAGKVVFYGQEIHILALPNNYLFAAAAGRVIFVGKFLDYSSLVVILHNRDYKSAIYGDFVPMITLGTFVFTGSIIGKIIDKSEPFVHFRMYFKNRKIFSTKTVDNFVENVQR